MATYIYRQEDIGDGGYCDFCGTKSGINFTTRSRYLDGLICLGCVCEINRLAGNGSIWNTAWGATTTTANVYPTHLDQEIINRVTNLISPNQNSMNYINAVAKRILDADTRKLVKAGLLDTNLELTCTGKAELHALIFGQFKADLVKVADELLDEEKEKKVK